MSVEDRREAREKANGTFTSEDQETRRRETLPVDPYTGEELAPRPQPGYYPGYDTLSQQAYWDEATRNVVLDRVHNVPPIRFFTGDEIPFMQAVVDCIIPQDDRTKDKRIPVLNYVDRRLYINEIDGYRFESMPPDQEAFRLGIRGIEAIAQHMYQRRFIDLGRHEQETVLKTLHDGKPPAGDDIWKRMSVHHFWMLLVQDCAEAYYAHPWAWDEIGFGGPAYPRGYMRLEHGQPEPWEAEEVRYAWEPPRDSPSSEYEPLIGGTGDHSVQTPGQSGTH